MNSNPNNAKKLIIDEEFRDLIPPLTQGERMQLHASLKQYGCRDPLIVWAEENILIDGHNRYDWLTSNGQDYPTIEMDFYDRESAKRFIILNQLGRRNVTPEIATILRAKYYDSIHNGRGGNHNPDGNNQTTDQEDRSKSQNDTLTNDAATEIAKKTGTSRATVMRDVKLARALRKLRISETDYMAGKVRDEHGKKRTKADIINEAFPAKDKTAKKIPSPPQPPADDEPSAIVVDGTKDDPPPAPAQTAPTPLEIVLAEIPKLNLRGLSTAKRAIMVQWNLLTADD